MNSSRSIFAFVFLLLASSCGVKDANILKDFSAMTDEEKRLPENALAAMSTAEGLEVELFASEPMVTNPTNISVDQKGRVWICEAYNYDVPPEQRDEKGDRIIVLEDTDGDGKADKRTVFYQGSDITTPLGIFVAGDQVYVSRSPNVLIFSDTNGDLVADKKDTLFTNLGNKGDHSAHSIFPGPDGKLYFTTGNYAGEIKDRSGNAIVDRAGFNVNQKGVPYFGGMIMRFDLDGNSFEVLGHNFRNNYEACVDSYGNIWQSDNDDDGNESCRINFIMPYGNYGFLDEMTGSTWTTNRVGMETDIPKRHWHQDDPGVVPNVLITGAGSPAGIAMYEGQMLPSSFHGMPVHAEPYYNSVRAYVTERNGAGFNATVREILKSLDQWFRPVDVSVAPDGSLFVADWYDPILGGGAAGDAKLGRIYRISKKAGVYKIDKADMRSPEENAAALKNPNAETRFLAQRNLISLGKESIPALETLWKSDDPLEKVRAFWVLAPLKDDAFIHEALKDPNANIRIAAIRFVLQNRKDVVPFLSQLSNDNDIHVKRELITALRYSQSPQAADLWVRMAEQYDGKDRWYLEALGIASDLRPDLYFEAWTRKVQFDPRNKNHQDIVWRIRSSHALPMIGDIIRNSGDADSTVRFFRAFDFHRDPGKNDIMLSLLKVNSKDREHISILALQQLDPSKVTRTPTLNQALKEALEKTKGTLSYIDLVRKFNLSELKGDLLKLAIAKSGTPEGSAAVDQLIRFNAYREIESVLLRADTSTVALLKSLNGKSKKEVIFLVSRVAIDSSKILAVRQAAVLTLGSSWPGEEALLNLVREKALASDLNSAASGVLFNVYRNSIQREAAKYLTRPNSRGTELPSIKELLASRGDESQGQAVFVKYCSTCHRIKSEGVKFAPELTQIGSKLSTEGIYRAIIYPDEGISHGFSASLVTMKDGTQTIGIIMNETSEEVELSLPGGTVNKYARAQIVSVKESEHSIMPALAPAMSRQELIDLTTYLAALKN
jgi:putative membrane-bound dehydrogenase-like protein